MVSDKHLQAYLVEFVLRYNRRKTRGVGRIAARVIKRLVNCKPLTMRDIIDDTARCRWFETPQCQQTWAKGIGMFSKLE